MPHHAPTTNIASQPENNSDHDSDCQGFVVVVGEVLWDCFENQSTLGGAPLNVAWNLAGLDLKPLFVSAVGDDALGKEIIQRMTDFGMSIDGVAVLPGVKTGTVQVTLDNGEPHYDIVSDVAWDQIPLASKRTVLADDGTSQTLLDMIVGRAQAAHDAELPVVFYHGSLALRDSRSRAAIAELRDALQEKSIGAEVFFDVNLRAPHYDQASLDLFRRHASFIKLNLDELGELSCDAQESVGKEANGVQQTAIEKTIAAGKSLNATSAVSLKTLLVTLGAEGAMAYQPKAAESCDTDDSPNAVCCNGSSNPLRVKSPPPEKMTDPVGAGDAFAAVVIHGIATKRPMADVLPDAVAFASRVCGLPGATCMDKDFYFLNSNDKKNPATSSSNRTS
ncbi:PfkB family carbohydrate kinase [Neorhodopirellula lusitana]|uniref:PfkB family carbohydrate kinase n=1 Tax=Neorhodopirellula lusitana TaxID=445327 RepID=UPI00384B1555